MSALHDMPPAMMDAIATQAVIPLLGDALADAALRFNLFPAEYAHPSWRAAADRAFVATGLSDLLPEPAHAATPATPARLRARSMALLRLRELERQYDFDFSDTGKRIALLDTPRLLALVEQTGALLARGRLRALIAGPEVAGVDAVIGRERRLLVLSGAADAGPLTEGLDTLREAAEAAVSDHEAWAQLPPRIALSVLPPQAIGVRARLRFRFPHGLRRLGPFPLDEMQRRRLVQIALLAAHALDDARTSALLAARPVSPATDEAEGRMA